MRPLIQRVENAARRAMAKQDLAHDWPHIERVRTMALRLAELEGCTGSIIIELAALVHDVGDRKAHQSEEAGFQATRELLAGCNVPDSVLEPVLDIAHRVSFRGFGVADDMPMLEGKIVQDADRLDAMGAIAIARTFTWGGAKGRPIHIPGESRVFAQNADEYYARGGRTSINHFYEKLLLLYGRLHTKSAREIGKPRHDFMVAFLAQFDAECHGRA